MNKSNSLAVVGVLLGLSFLPTAHALEGDDPAGCRLRTPAELRRATTRVTERREELRITLTELNVPTIAEGYAAFLTEAEGRTRRPAARVLAERRYLNAMTRNIETVLTESGLIEQRDQALAAIQRVRSATFPLFSHYQCERRLARAAREIVELGERVAEALLPPIDGVEVACGATGADGEEVDATDAVSCSLAAGRLVLRGGDELTYTPSVSDRGFDLAGELTIEPAVETPVEEPAASSASDS